MTLISEITPQPTRTAIDEHLEGQQTPRHSNRLGGSVIGKKCSRELFYGFRWAFPAEKFKGRILRLFGVGHQLEAEFSNYIRNTGANVYELDPVTGKQFEVNAIGGHVVGFLDGKGIGLAEAPKQMHLIEYKTHNDKSFKDLVKKGLQVSKPEHYAQMQTYMHLTGLTCGLYVAYNKNDSDLHVIRVKYNNEDATALMAKAERIITDIAPPAKISTDPSHFDCRFCKAFEICHKQELPERNCRTCMHSYADTMGDKGQWVCGKDKKVIATAFQKQTHPCHRYLPQLLSWKQCDAKIDEDSGELISVGYQRDDGIFWDSGPGVEAEVTPPPSPEIAIMPWHVMPGGSS